MSNLHVLCCLHLDLFQKASIAEAADIGRSTPQDPVRQQMRWTVNENGEVVPDLLFNITSSMNALLGANANASKYKHIQTSTFGEDHELIARYTVIHSTH